MSPTTNDQPNENSETKPLTFGESLDRFKDSMVAVSSLQMELCTLILSKAIDYLKTEGTIASSKDLERVTGLAEQLQSAASNNWGDALSVPAMKDLIEAKRSEEL